MQFGVVVGLLNYALQFVPSSRAALIFATSPLLTMLLATTFGYERASKRKAIGVVLTIVGVGLALDEQIVLPESSSVRKGFYTFYSRATLRRAWPVAHPSNNATLCEVEVAQPNKVLQVTRCTVL